ncbi:Anaerobic nitric oxide reductase flavorubredoxin [Leclercia adecarboxylata]|uniref:Anaerobic nitric oxide reductase flavorubredoxin n=1 Tax=Leclercia adecarboxylata TaxID=83655 RepID=A0A4U9IGZ5_9ENTR|nr:Anaerobic nitric oxide reductase flavorubredoxin [Leclercia adecarboxylata]
MSILVKNNIHWVGQRDWEVRDFHGTEYKTLRGSSYNSYLIREEKNVLIDTVDHKFSREFVQNLRSEIDLADIDYIIINHAEEDHAGALTELMSCIPDTPNLLHQQRHRLHHRSPPPSRVEFQRGENR